MTCSESSVGGASGQLVSVIYDNRRIKSMRRIMIMKEIIIINIGIERNDNITHPAII